MNNNMESLEIELVELQDIISLLETVALSGSLGKNLCSTSYSPCSLC